MKQKKEIKVSHPDFYCHDIDMDIECECERSISVTFSRTSMPFGEFQCNRCKKRYFVYLEVERIMSEKQFKKITEDTKKKLSIGENDK